MATVPMEPRTAAPAVGTAVGLLVVVPLEAPVGLLGAEVVVDMPVLVAEAEAEEETLETTDEELAAELEDEAAELLELPEPPEPPPVEQVLPSLMAAQKAWVAGRTLSVREEASHVSHAESCS